MRARGIRSVVIVLYIPSVSCVLPLTVCRLLLVSIEGHDKYQRVELLAFVQRLPSIYVLRPAAAAVLPRTHRCLSLISVTAPGPNRCPKGGSHRNDRWLLEPNASSPLILSSIYRPPFITRHFAFTFHKLRNVARFRQAKAGRAAAGNPPTLQARRSER